MIGFFDIVFECNARKTLEECGECRFSEECDKFQMYFETSPDVVWSMVSSFEDLQRYIGDWWEYQNEQTNEY